MMLTRTLALAALLSCALCFTAAAETPATPATPAAEGTDATTPPAAPKAPDEVVLASRNWAAAANYRLDFTVPEAPALALLGIDSAEVATPRDAPAVAAELANFVDANGHVKPGGALTVQPYWLGGRNITLGQYRDDRHRWERRLLARTQISLAAAQVPDSADAVRVGLGLTFQPLDSSDPRMDRNDRAHRARLAPGDSESDAAFAVRAAKDGSIWQCMDATVQIYEGSAEEEADKQLRAEAAAQHVPNVPDYLNQHMPERVGMIVDKILDDKGDEYRELHTQVANNLDACESAWRRRQTQQSNLTIAIGQTYVSTTGQTSNLDPEGVTAWVGYSHGIPLEWIFPSFGPDNYMSRFNLYVRYADNETVALDASTHAQATVTVAAFALNFAAINPERSNWQLGIEAAYRQENFDGPTRDRERTQLALNGAVRLNAGLWLRAAYGTRDSGDDEFFRISFVMSQKAPS